MVQRKGFTPIYALLVDFQKKTLGHDNFDFKTTSFLLNYIIQGNPKNEILHHISVFKMETPQ